MDFGKRSAALKFDFTIHPLSFLIQLGDVVVPARNSAIKTQLTIRRRFQFSSALKRMSTISSLPGGRLLIAVKGAPETIKTMLSVVPKGYDDTYKWFTRKGSRVLALAMKEMDALSSDKVSIYPTVLCLMSRSYAVYSRSTSFTVNKPRAS